MNTKKYRPVLTNMLASLKANLGILAVLVIMVVALSLLSPVFLTQNNILSVGRQMFSNICLSLGMTFVIIIGGIDLSVGAIVALSGITSVGLVINGGWAVAPAVIAGILIGTLCGILNGCIISWLKVPAFIVTMAMMNVARGAAQIYTGGTAIRIQSVDAFTQLGVGRLFNVPYQIYYAVVLIILATLVLNRTKFGTYVFATGGNRLAARLSGIKTARIERITYTISGTMAGITGVILSARMYSAQPSVGDGLELDAIAACVLGGVSMSGGMGRISGTIIGAIIIGLINNGLNLMSVNSYWQLVAKGVIILLAIAIDAMKNRGRLAAAGRAKANLADDAENSESKK